MAVNLFALCRTDGLLIVKRVVVTAAVQRLLEGIFAQQENDLLAGRSEIAFDGGWKPEPNEILFMPTTTEIDTVVTDTLGNIAGLDPVDPANFAAEGIRALGVVVDRAGKPRLLLQTFSPQQILNHKISLVYDGNTFNQLTQPAFTLASSLAGVVEGGRVKFVSYSNIRQVFDLKHLYEAASDAQIDTFAKHKSLKIEDLPAFIGDADQTVRKLVHAITARGTLDQFSVPQIVRAAASQGLSITVSKGAIEMPTAKGDAKKVLYFLDEGFFRGPMTGLSFITNSKRAV